MHYAGLSKPEVVRLRAEQGIPELDLSRYSGIIAGGSPYDVCTPEDKKSPTQIQVEADFNRLFDKLIKQDFPFIGSCCGNAMLGNYLGASISRKYGEPVSGVDLQLTTAGKQDPLLQGIPTQFRVLLGHKEACDDTPPGSVLLAKGSQCLVQMFRVGQNIYATQFHPEGDPESFTFRIGIYKDHGYFPPETADQLSASLQGEHTPHAHQILKNFVNRYRV